MMKMERSLLIIKVCGDRHRRFRAISNERSLSSDGVSNLKGYFSSKWYSRLDPYVAVLENEQIEKLGLLVMTLVVFCI